MGDGWVRFVHSPCPTVSEAGVGVRECESVVFRGEHIRLKTLELKLRGRVFPLVERDRSPGPRSETPKEDPLNRGRGRVEEEGARVGVEWGCRREETHRTLFAGSRE